MRLKRRNETYMSTKTTKTTGQPRSASVAGREATTASTKPRSKKSALRKKSAAKARKSPKDHPAESSASNRTLKPPKNIPEPENPPSPQAEGKGAKILALIRRVTGASQTELRQATGWQPHSIRGFLSTASKKHNFKISSVKNEAGERIYTAVQ